MNERLRVTNILVEHNYSALNDNFPKNKKYVHTLVPRTFENGPLQIQ